MALEYTISGVRPVTTEQEARLLLAAWLTEAARRRRIERKQEAGQALSEGEALQLRVAHMRARLELAGII